MRWATVLVLLLAVAPVRADIKTTTITFKSGTEKIKGFLAMPEGKGPFPAVVVIQEWWGLSDWIKDNAKRLARQGYVALAPDLYRGKLTTDRRVAYRLMTGMPRDRALRDLTNAVRVLAANPKVDKKRIGCVGWCMGGGYALQLALKDERIKACAICYGRLVTDPKMLQPLKAEVLGIFGKEDKGIPPKTVKKFEEALKKADKKVAGIHLYKAGHGFMRPGKSNPAYEADAAKSAWKEIEQFFAQTLKSK